MSITIENPEFETLLAAVAASTGRDGGDLLVDLLRREQARLDGTRAERIADGFAADEELRARLSERPVVDPRPADAILAYDENGLPA